MAEAGGPVKVTLQQLGVATGEEYEGQLDMDIGHLTAFDPAPLDAARMTVDAAGTCAEAARGITQYVPKPKPLTRWQQFAAKKGIPGEDPFAALAAEKRERVKQNKANQLGNLKAAAKRAGASALPASLRLAATLPGENKKVGKGTDKSMRRKELKEDIKSASRLAGISTASIGKFDKRLKGEKPGERTPLGKRRNFASVTDTKSERTKMGG
eukprot:XP_001689510.1 predicted protein [Chlamydomonas reinhardtii]